MFSNFQWNNKKKKKKKNKKKKNIRTPIYKRAARLLEQETSFNSQPPVFTWQAGQGKVRVHKRKTGEFEERDKQFLFVKEKDRKNGTEVV